MRRGRDAESAKEILDEYMKGFQDRNPQLYVFSAHLHMDEATPHLHIDFVPFTTEGKRKLDTRVSLKGALKQQGFIGTGRNDTERAQWAESEKGIISVKTPFGNRVNVYCIEHTLCDILQERYCMDIQIVTDAYKRYARYKEKNLKQLMEFSKLARVEEKVRRYIEALI